uniref:Ataxin 2 n=1 Tax=Octopus tankahkeei TaxID=794816 RepID=G9BX56_9MOLL|nr:ataxin 2 [Octopus tankahkeei]
MKHGRRRYGWRASTQNEPWGLPTPRGNPPSNPSRNPVDSLKFGKMRLSPDSDSVYNNSRFIYVGVCLLGNPVSIQVKNGNVYEGILLTFSHKMDIVLSMAHKVDDRVAPNCNSVIPNKENIIDNLIIKSSEIVKLEAKNVDLEYAVKDNYSESSSRFNGQLGDKDLTPWEGDLEDGKMTSLDSDASNGWDPSDMFRTNYEQFNVISTYDENLSQYTTPLQRRDTKEYKEREEAAAKLADEIERSDSYKHRISLENGEGEDEEKFAAVVKPEQQQQQSSNAPGRNAVPLRKVPSRGGMVGTGSTGVRGSSLSPNNMNTSQALSNSSSINSNSISSSSSLSSSNSISSSNNTTNNITTTSTTTTTTTATNSNNSNREALCNPSQSGGGGGGTGIGGGGSGGGGGVVGGGSSSGSSVVGGASSNSGAATNNSSSSSSSMAVSSVTVSTTMTHHHQQQQQQQTPSQQQQTPPATVADPSPQPSIVAQQITSTLPLQLQQNPSNYNPPREALPSQPQSLPLQTQITKSHDPASDSSNMEQLKVNGSSEKEDKEILVNRSHIVPADNREIVPASPLSGLDESRRNSNSKDRASEIEAYKTFSSHIKLTGSYKDKEKGEKSERQEKSEERKDVEKSKEFEKTDKLTQKVKNSTLNPNAKEFNPKTRETKDWDED